MGNELWHTISAWFLIPTVVKFVGTIGGILVIVTISRIIQRSLRRLENNDNRYRLRKFVNAFGMFAAIVLVLVVFSDRLGNLTVALGVAGAGIAFALQEVIASIAGWVALSFGKFYSAGDRVQLGGIVGDVIDISVLRTTLMEIGQWVKGDLYNGRIVRVANSFVFKEPVFNYSDFNFLWDEITVSIKYGSDYKLARDMLQRIADDILVGVVPEAKKAWHGMVDRYLIEDARIEPKVTLLLNEKGIEFTVRYVTDYKDRRSTKDRLFTKVLEEIDSTEGKIALA